MTITSSSAQRGLDSVILVYSLLKEHPASAVCEQFIRSREGWVSSVLVLFEVRAVLTKVYRSEAGPLHAELERLASGPIRFDPMEVKDALVAARRAEDWEIDVTDAALLDVCLRDGAPHLCTDDRKLARAAENLGLSIECPIDDALRDQIRDWETNELPARGLARILHRTHSWLHKRNPALAEDFRSSTGGWAHLP